MSRLSPAAQHMARVAAKQAATEAKAQMGTMANANVYEQFMAKLQQDHLRLKQIQSAQGKGELKKQLLPEYSDYIQGVLESGAGVQDDVISTLMAWAVDAADYDLAADLGEYVVKHNLKLPDRFDRTPATFLADEIGGVALETLKRGETFSRELVTRVGQLTAPQDMPDQARAKIHLALGRIIAAGLTEQSEEVDITTARVNLARAIELHHNCGGKKDLEKVDRLLKKHAELAKAAAAAGEPDGSTSEGTTGEAPTDQPPAN